MIKTDLNREEKNIQFCIQVGKCNVFLQDGGDLAQQ